MVSLSSIECRLGRHEFTAWQYIDEQSCRQVRTCSREDCGRRDERLFHGWSEWQYRDETSCIQKRICLLCAEEEVSTKPEHIWATVYAADKVCQKVVKCIRCGEPCDDRLVLARELPKTLRPVHQLGAWEYEAPNSCKQVRVCLRCDRQETREQPHQLGAWEYEAPNSCKQVRVCLRCDRQETREQHTWSEWTYTTEGKCWQVHSCQRCDADEERLEHQKSPWRYVDRRSRVVVRLCPRCKERFTEETQDLDKAAEDSRVDLRVLLAGFFSESELKTLCFDLGWVDYEDLPEDGKANKARALVQHCERNGRLKDLVEKGFHFRPNAMLSRDS